MGIDRRRFLQGSAVASAGLALGAAGTGTAAAATPAPRSAPPVSQLPSPTARKGSYLDVNGARIFYQDTGHGEPMLLLHGYPLSGALWGRNVPALAQRYRVITIDQRGFGQSTAPSPPSGVDVFAQDALAVLDHLEISKAIIGGHSLGGAVVLDMYRRAPDRFRGMLLIDTTPAAAATIEAAEWNGFESAAQKGETTTIVDFLIPLFLTGATRTQHPDLVTYQTAVIKSASKNGLIGGARAPATRADARSLLPRIAVPTLVYVGVEDAVYPVPVAQRTAKAIPHSTLVTIPGGAHAAVFEVPEPTNQKILAWAASHDL